MSHSNKGSKRHKCFKFVEVSGKVLHRFEDKGTSQHSGNAWTKRVLNKASRRGAKLAIQQET